MVLKATPECLLCYEGCSVSENPIGFVLIGDRLLTTGN